MRFLHMPPHIRFQIGQPICNKLSRYRGVVIQADPLFSQTEAWYDIMVNTHSPKDEPWYWILLDDSLCMAYVPQKDLTPDLSSAPINNPFVTEFFGTLACGLYTKLN